MTWQIFLLIATFWYVVGVYCMKMAASVVEDGAPPPQKMSTGEIFTLAPVGPLLWIIVILWVVLIEVTEWGKAIAKRIKGDKE